MTVERYPLQVSQQVLLGPGLLALLRHLPAQARHEGGRGEVHTPYPSHLFIVVLPFCRIAKQEYTDSVRVSTFSASCISH